VRKNRNALAGYDAPTASPSAGRTTGPAASVPPASSPEIKSLLGLAVAAIVVAALYVAQEVLVQITLAVLLSFVLAPLVNLLRRVGLWRAPAVIASVLLALGVIGLMGTLLGSQAALLAADAPRYAETIERKFVSAQAFTTARLTAITQTFGGIKAVSPRPATPLPASSSARSSAPAAARPLLVEIATPETSTLVVARTILEPVLAPLETTIIVLVVAIFILMQKEDLRDRFIRVFGSTDLHRTTQAIDDAGERLSRYFVSQLAVNTCFGVVIGVGLWLIGVPSAPLWGVLGGLLRFVPYIGSLIAAVAPIALAAAIDPGWSKAFDVALLFVVVEPLTGWARSELDDAGPYRRHGRRRGVLL